MDEIQGIITYLAGLTSLALAIEGVKAAIWATITAIIFRWFGIVVVRLERRR